MNGILKIILIGVAIYCIGGLLSNRLLPSYLWFMSGWIFAIIYSAFYKEAK